MNFKEFVEIFGFGRKIKIKRIFLISLVSTVFFLTVGITPLIWTWNEHLNYNFNPEEMIEPNNENIIALNAKFEEYLSISSIYDNTSRTEFVLLYKFINIEFDYKSDFSNNFAIHHLDSIDNIFKRGNDDCDGFAVVTCSLLRYRGYDAYVFMNMVHAWVNVYSEGQFLSNFFTALNNPFVKFNDLGSEFYPNEISFLFSMYLITSTASLILLNIMVIIGFDLTKKIKRRYSQWLYDITVQKPSLSTPKTVYAKIKSILIDSYYNLKFLFSFIFHNWVAISFILLYLIITLYTALLIIGIVGMSTGVWRYEESYLQRGFRLEEQGVFLLSGFFIAIFWLAIYLAGMNTIWNRIGKNGEITVK